MMKCELCQRKIETTFLEKLNGTAVKMKDGDKNKLYYVCSDCQKKFGKDLKDEISKK